MKKRVLYFSPMEWDNTAFYRSSGVLPYLDCPEYEVVNGSSILDWNWSTFVSVDLFFCHRPCTQQHLDMMMLAKDMGVSVVIDFDDNLFAVTQDNPTHQFYQDMRLNILKSLRISDEIWVTTEAVKVAYEKFKPGGVVVIPNSHNDYLLKNKRPFNPHTKHVMWRGGQTHEADVYSVADELIKVVNEHKDWTFNFFGHAFTYLEQRCQQNYIRTPMMTTMQYFKALEDYNPNIFICPLVDNEFNRGKSNIAWIEATYGGAAFFGNKALPEFNNEWIGDINNFLSEQLSHWNDLKYMNDRSWQLITDTLLLSKVNQLRHNRILELI